MLNFSGDEAQQGRMVIFHTKDGYNSLSIHEMNPDLSAAGAPRPGRCRSLYYQDMKKSGFIELF
jgi:hypothetical protein